MPAPSARRQPRRGAERCATVLTAYLVTVYVLSTYTYCLLTVYLLSTYCLLTIYLLCTGGWLRLDLPPALDAEPAGAGCQAATEPAAEPAAAPAAPAAAPSAEPAVRSAPAPLPPRGRRLSLTLRHALYLRDPRRGELWDDVRGEQAWSKCPLGTAPARILRLLRAHLAALSGVGTPSERPAH